MTRLSYLLLAVPLAVFSCRGPAPSRAHGIPEHSATIPTPRDENWIAFQEHIRKIAVRDAVDLVFLGDSITYGWWDTAPDVWREYYGERDAANLGIGGDRTEQVLWRIENGAFDGLQPALIVLQIGTNNTVPKYGNAANSPQEIAEGVVAIVQRLRDKLPRARILVLGIFPRGKGPQHPLRQKIAAANEILAEEITDRPGVHYLDISDRLVGDDGQISQDVMADYLHLTPLGYRTWADAMESLVRELMGETR